MAWSYIPGYKQANEQTEFNELTLKKTELSHLFSGVNNIEVLEMLTNNWSLGSLFFL